MDEKIVKNLETLNSELVEIGFEPVEYAENRTELQTKTLNKANELRKEITDDMNLSHILDDIQEHIYEEVDKISVYVDEKVSEATEELQQLALDAVSAALPSSAVARATESITKIRSKIETIREQVNNIRERVVIKTQEINIKANILASKEMSKAIKRSQNRKKQKATQDKMNQLRNDV